MSIVFKNIISGYECDGSQFKGEADPMNVSVPLLCYTRHWIIVEPMNKSAA